MNSNEAEVKLTLTLETMVGPIKFPFSKPSTLISRPSNSIYEKKSNFRNFKIIHYIYTFHKVKYDRPGECSPEKDCLR